MTTKNEQPMWQNSFMFAVAESDTMEGNAT